MSLLLQSPIHGNIQLWPRLPEGYKGFILPGGQVWSNVGEFGTILIQELVAEHYTIRYNVCQFLQKMAIKGSSNIPGLQSRVMLKNNLSHHIKNIGNIQLRQDEFTMFYANLCQGKASFHKNLEYQCFDACYSLEWLQQLAAAFPAINKVIANASKGKPVLLAKSPILISPHSKDIIYNLLHCQYNEGMRRLYFETRIREYLLLLLHKSLSPPQHEKLTAAEIDAVHAAKNIILQNIESHHTIPEISKQVGLNEFKLKAAYQQLVGMGLFETLLQARMQNAKQLLLSTAKPIKEIASETGYNHTTSFITAFRKHFGYTPASLRRP